MKSHLFMCVLLKELSKVEVAKQERCDTITITQSKYKWISHCFINVFAVGWNKILFWKTQICQVKLEIRKPVIEKFTLILSNPLSSTQSNASLVYKNKTWSDKNSCSECLDKCMWWRNVSYITTKWLTLSFLVPTFITFMFRCPLYIGIRFVLKYLLVVWFVVNMIVMKRNNASYMNSKCRRMYKKAWIKRCLIVGVMSYCL
jgi:hypothetical protein